MPACARKPATITVSVFLANCGLAKMARVSMAAGGFSTANQSNRFGSFTYNSLADLEANTPAEFRRSLNATERNGGSSTGAIYLGDTWRKSRAVQLTMGVRLEGSAYDGRPAYNPAVDSLFGHRTDFFPTDVRISPHSTFGRAM